MRLTQLETEFRLLLLRMENKARSLAGDVAALSGADRYVKRTAAAHTKNALDELLKLHRPAMEALGVEWRRDPRLLPGLPPTIPRRLETISNPTEDENQEPPINPHML